MDAEHLIDEDAAVTTEESQTRAADFEDEAELGDEAAPLTEGKLIPPLGLRVSGRYRRRLKGPVLPVFNRNELRLDVDGRYPQMTASGTLRLGFSRLHWIASLTKVAVRTWEGTIWYKDGPAALLPHTTVRIVVVSTLLTRTARVSFGGALPVLRHVYDFVSSYFDRVEFEFDTTADATPSLSIDTHDHPNRPATLPAETLDTVKVFRRAGFDTTVSAGSGGLPIDLAGADTEWSNLEMHDAMQLHWSRFANLPQWRMWVMHGRRHEWGFGLGGIMFDDIGPNHRQGTAVFTDSFISSPPAGDAAPAAWVARNRFYTMCHEIGHAFNLAHSWQKSLGAPWGTPWIPLTDEPEARSFMNYPDTVAGGQSAFFADFAFRFSDIELLFMRHAPRRFVQMGNANWFDHHGFEQANASPQPALELKLRLNHDRPRLQFLEPAMVELKVTNVSGQPMVIDDDLLADSDRLTLVIKRRDRAARLWRPYARLCSQPRKRVLDANESIYQPLFIGAGLGGWMIDEPGHYVVQACLHLETGEDVVSAPLGLRVEPPAGTVESLLAQDLFNDDVGRTLAFDGTRALQGANDVLREISAQLPDKRVTRHAQLALGLPLQRDGKLVEPQATKVTVVRGRPEEARQLLGRALVDDSATAAATLGHIEYRAYAETFASWLSDAGEKKESVKVIDTACDTLSQRKVKPEVVQQLREFGQLLSMGGDAARRVRRTATTGKTPTAAG